MKFFKRFLSVVFTLAIISLPIIIWLQRQEINDWYQLRNYTPPNNIVALADATTMTPQARRIFYVNHPEVDDQEAFNAACSREASIVIGCYVPGKGIFLFNINDSRLKGVMEVTAAHEMLHAAYERLSSTEQARIDGLTSQAIKNVTDQRILDTVERYRSQDAAVVPNELHSILATEVKNLPPELETYYQQYFTDRSKIVGFSAQYEAEFSSRQSQVAKYDAQLEDIKQQIEADKTELSLQYKALESQRQQIDSVRASGDIAAYNAQVPGFNAAVNNYNALVKEADRLIANYNSIVKARNELAVEVQDLAEAIDSRPQNF